MKSPQTPQEAADRLFKLLRVVAPSCAVMMITFVVVANIMDRSGWSRLDGLLIVNTGGLALIIVVLLVVVYALACHLRFKQN